MTRRALTAATLLLLSAQLSESFVTSQPNHSASFRRNHDIRGGGYAVKASHMENLDCHWAPASQHRHSAGDWLHNVFSLPKSSVLREIRNPVLTIAAWSSLVSAIHFLCNKSTSVVANQFARKMCIGTTPHSFVVSALGLLLVFRTNSAYQRFYEGRKIWENILSVSRNLSRMMNLYEEEVGTQRKHRIVNLLAAFPYLLRHHVRPGCLCESQTMTDEKYRFLLKEPSLEMVQTRHEGDKDIVSAFIAKECWVDKRKLPWCLLGGNKALEKVAKAQNRPLWVTDRIGREVMDIPYGPNFTSRERLSFIGQIDKLTNAIGQCERIHQTAVPLNYARHALRSLTLWLVTLPFALVRDLGLLTGPTMAAISWLLLGVYQIGYSIEDPFQGSLRLSILCDAIRRDVIGETQARQTAFSYSNEGIVSPPPSSPQVTIPTSHPVYLARNGTVGEAYQSFAGRGP